MAERLAPRQRLNYGMPAVRAARISRCLLAAGRHRSSSGAARRRRSLRERGRREYDRLAEELRGCAQVIDATDDWAGALKRLNADHPPTPESMRQADTGTTEQARQFLREHELVTFLRPVRSVWSSRRRCTRGR